MMSGNGTLPAARYIAALQAGNTPAQAYEIAYPTPKLFSDNKAGTK